MKASHIFLPVAAVLLMSMAACHSQNEQRTNGSAAPDTLTETKTETSASNVRALDLDSTIPMAYDIPVAGKESTFIIISKKLQRLSVYGVTQGGDTVLLARYPVCLSRNKGQKQGSGDMRTPESEPGHPFHIKQIQDASDWHHDFGDGRGEILSYGHWFLRLETPFSGIGIHGSTNNENSVPGRDSEGCIRLRDQDIIHLHDNYAWVGMPVTIQTEEADPLPFEAKAVKGEGKAL